MQVLTITLKFLNDKTKSTCISAWHILQNSYYKLLFSFMLLLFYLPILGVNRGCASESKNPGKMVVMDFVTNMFKHLNLDVKKGPTPYLGLTQPLGAVLRT